MPTNDRSFPFHQTVFTLFGFLIWTGAGLHAQTEPPHPILTISGSGSGADTVLNTSEANYLNLVPRQAPRNDSFGFVPAVVSGDTGWSWSAATPNQITSTPSGTVFPNSNPAYPLKTESVQVLSGKTIQAPYYNRAGSSTAKSLVPFLINHYKRNKLRSDLIALAQRYMASGSSHAARDQRYARRVAVALDDWAKYVPDYVMTEKNSASFINAGPAYKLTADKQRASDHNGLAHEWHTNELLAFDAIYDSPALAQLSAEKGYDVRAHIKDNLFCNIGDFFVERVPVSVAIATNLSGPFTVLARTARVLNRPDYIHWLDDYLTATVRQKILRDGVLPEGIGYSYGYVTENISASRDVRDYFDTRPANTPRLVDIKTRVEGYVSVLEAGQARWNALRLPNGQFPSFGDTTFNSITARNTGVSGLLPAYGHLALGAGSGSKSVQLSQNFSDNANHMRADVTAFTLWAKGSELLGNIRYFNGTPGRQFTEQILAYNAVTIDRTNMSRTSWTVGKSGHRFTSGNLTLYEPGSNGIAVSEIDGQRAYSNKASRYQRLMILNTTDQDRPYVVDVFRVAGGLKHDYTLHGSIRFDQTWECSFPLTANPAQYPLLEGSETWSEPASSGSSFPYYGFWRDVSSGNPVGNFQVTFRDASRSNPRDLRLWMTDSGAATVHLGRTPNPERTNAEPPNFYKYWRPSLILRRTGSGSLQSLFAGVIEPMSSGQSVIQSVERLPISGGGNEAVAIRVTLLDGRVDTYVINLKNSKIAGAAGGSDVISTSNGQYTLAGRVGVHTTGPGGNRVWTVAASSFQYPGGQLANANAMHQGTVTDMVRRAAGGSGDAFVTGASLPAGIALRGRQLSLRFETYRVVNSSAVQNGISEMFEIDRVEQANGQTYIYLTRDHQMTLASGKVTELMAPERVFEGSFTFEITGTAAATDATPSLTAINDRTIDEDASTEAIPFTVQNPDGSTDGITVTATSSNTALVPNGNIVIATASNPWTSADVGTVGVAGSSTPGDVFTVRASGADFWGTADGGHFIYQPMSGNGEIVARVTGVQNTNAWAKAGVMMRTSTEAGSAHGFMLISASNGASFQRRPAAGGSSASSSTAGVAAPAWVRLVKSGNTLTGYHAADNAGAPGAWVQTGTATVELGTNFLVGLAATSHVNGTAGAYTFDHVSGPASVGGNRTVTVTPAANASGTATITLTVRDPAGATASVAFTLVVNAVNDAPTLSSIANQSLPMNGSTGAIPFSITDAETAPSGLVLTRTSSNTALIPLSGIVFGGSGSSRTVTVTPAANQTGMATLTVIVSDGEKTAEQPFSVTVEATASQSWRIQHFGSADAAGNAADTADPDHDGIANLLEFALDGDPNAGGVGILPMVAREGGDLTLTYTRRKDALGELTFAAEAATEPGSLWSAAGVTEEIVADNGMVQAIRARVAAGGDNQKFLRLRITRE